MMSSNLAFEICLYSLPFFFPACGADHNLVFLLLWWGLICIPPPQSSIINFPLYAVISFLNNIMRYCFACLYFWLCILLLLEIDSETCEEERSNLRRRLVASSVEIERWVRLLLTDILFNYVLFRMNFYTIYTILIVTFYLAENEVFPMIILDIWEVSDV